MTLSKEDIKQYSPEDLQEKCRDMKLQLKKLEFNHAIAALENPLELRILRRDIARLLTEMRYRDLNQAEK